LLRPPRTIAIKVAHYPSLAYRCDLKNGQIQIIVNAIPTTNHIPPDIFDGVMIGSLWTHRETLAKDLKRFQKVLASVKVYPQSEQSPLERFYISPRPKL